MANLLRDLRYVCGSSGPPDVVRQRVNIYLKRRGGHNRQHMSVTDWPGACKELLLKGN